MDYVRLGQLEISRFIVGCNPFSGFSHQSMETDREMMSYYTTERIKATLRDAERLGVTTHLGRADHHMIRVFLELQDEGFPMKWVAQTCTEFGMPLAGVRKARYTNADAIYIHGGQMDHLIAQRKYSEIHDAINCIHDAGLPAGVAGHTPAVHEWAEAHLDLDFYMCSYYNPANRAECPSHDPNLNERYLDEDRERMVRFIAHSSRPVIHYKIMAAGRNEPRAAFAYAAQHMRPQDAVCVGVYTKINPTMIAEDIDLLYAHLRATQAPKGG
jgi:hypothetical protein